MIFKAAKDGVSGEIGKHLLEFPINEVGVELEAQKDVFNLVGEVAIDIKSGRMFQGNLDPEEIVKSVTQKYSSNNPGGRPIERGRNFIITAPRGTKLVLSKESGFDRINITTGVVKEGFSSREGIQIVPAPSSTRESFDTVVADFNEVLQEMVEETYRQDGKTSPDEELILRPPKVGINGRERRGRRTFEDVEAREDLLDKMEIEKPDVKFEDIGGQTEAKREIEGLAFALKNPDLYQKWGTKPPKGIILYGPPGTGKTLMAKALASQADARFFHVEASDIASKWYGESEKIVKGIFDLAASTGEKTIIFFDEVDAVAPQREGAHQATQRTVSTLLENMDGMVANENVLVVASTNRLESVDSALLRAGRFDRWVEVPLPDEEGRKQILDIHMRKAEKIANRTLFSQVDVGAIASTMEKSSGADIAEIVRRVLEEKVRQEGMGQEANSVSTDDILREIKGYEKIRETKRRLGFQTPQPRTNLQQEEASQ